MEDKEVIGWDANGSPVYAGVKTTRTSVLSPMRSAKKELLKLRKRHNTLDRHIGRPTYGELKQKLAKAERKRDRMHRQIGRLSSSVDRWVDLVKQRDREAATLRHQVSMLKNTAVAVEYGTPKLIRALQDEVQKWKSRAHMLGWGVKVKAEAKGSGWLSNIAETRIVQPSDIRTLMRAPELIAECESLCRTIQGGQTNVDAGSGGDTGAPEAQGPGEETGLEG